MALVIWRDDPTGATGQEIIDHKGSITEFLMTRVFDVDYISIDLNGSIITVDKDNPDERLFDDLCEFDRVVIINQPKGMETIIAAVVAVVAAVAVTLLMPSINPNDMGVKKDSPNNNLSAQTNQARPYQAIPDILGEPRPYPDLTGEAAQEYVQKDVGQAQKVITQLMSVSLETYEVDEVYTSDTLLSQIGGTYTVYQPVNCSTVVPLVQETFSINEVDGQELFAPDQVESQFTIEKGPVQDSGSIVRVDSDSYTITTTLDMSKMGDITSLPVTGNFTITYNLDTGEQRTQNFTALIQTYEFTAGDHVIGIKTDDSVTATNLLSGIKVVVNEKTTIGPFSTPVDGDQLWMDFTFPRGLKGECIVDVNYTMETDTQTVSDSITYTFSKDSLDQQYYTQKITSKIGECKWTVDFIRVNDVGDDANSPTLVKLERVASLREQRNKNYGNVTLIEVVIPATLQATSLRENKVNLRGGRMVIGYNRQTRQVDYTLRRSRLGADLLLHEYVMVFGKSPSDLDLVTLYDIYDNLPDPRLGYFDFTFDDLDVSLGARMETILNAARIYLVPDGNRYTFNRDEKKLGFQTLLGRRDISGSNRQYTYSYSPQMPSDKDSVRVEYVDTETNKKAFIERKVLNGQFVQGVGANPVKVELPCVKEEYNAVNRAELEIRKLFYLRETISDTFINSNASLVTKGNKIRYEEVYGQPYPLGGEITFISGSTVFTSEEIPDGNDMFIEFTDIYGQLSQALPITKTGNKSCTVNGDISSMFTAGTNYAKGSMYVISTLESLGALEYIATEVNPSSDGKTVQIVMSKNDDRVFDYDEV